MGSQTQLPPPPKEGVSHWDAEQLAAYICGLDPEEADTDSVDEALIEKFNLDIGGLQEILCHLLPLIDVGESPLTKKCYKGFGYIDRDGHETWAVRMEIPARIQKKQ